MTLPPQILEFILRPDILDVHLYHGFRGAIVMRFLHSRCPQMLPTHHTVVFKLNQPELTELTLRTSCGVFMSEYQIKKLTEEE